MVNCVLMILFSDDILAGTSTGFADDVCRTRVVSEVSTKLGNSKETWSPEVTTTPVASDSANGGDTVGPIDVKNLFKVFYFFFENMVF